MARYILVVVSVVVLSMTQAAPPSLAQPSAVRPAAGTPTWQVFAPPPQSPFLPGASAVAADGQGNLYVVLRPVRSIAKISPTGQTLAQWGASDLHDPQAIAVDKHGAVYVADAAAIGVRKYSTAGRLLGSVQTGMASGIALDGRGHLLVSLKTAKGVDLLTLGTGLKHPQRHALHVREKFSMTFSGPCGSNDQCQASAGYTEAGPLAVGQGGNIFVALAVPFELGKNGEYDQNVIQRLTPGGAVQKEWPVDLGGEAIAGLAVGRNGDIAASAPRSHQVIIWAPQGKHLGTWGRQGCGAGRLQAPMGISGASDGGYLVADADNQNIAHLTARGATVGLVGGCPSYEFAFSWGVALDASGNVYVGTNHQVAKLAPSGTVLARWNLGPYVARGMQVDAQGNLFVADDHHILKVAPDGHIAQVFGGIAGFAFSRDVAVDGAGNLYVAEQDASRIDKLSPTGTVLARWGARGSQEGQFDAPLGVALDAQGNIYVADYNNNRIQKLSPSGSPLAVWADFGQGRKLGGPVGVTIDHQGNVWISDGADDHVIELSSGGTWLGSWGTQGSIRPGELIAPAGIAVDTHGSVYVADSNRVQKLVF